VQAAINIVTKVNNTSNTPETLEPALDLVAWFYSSNKVATFNSIKDLLKNTIVNLRNTKESTIAWLHDNR